MSDSKNADPTPTTPIASTKTDTLPENVSVDMKMLANIDLLMDWDLVKNEGSWPALENLNVIDQKDFDSMAKGE